MFVTFSKDKVMNFKKFLYAFAAVLMTVIAPSCVKDGFGEPMISTDKSTYEVPLEGGEVKILLTSTRSWTAKVLPATSLDDVEGIEVIPASGEASEKPVEVIVKAAANASFPRAALISFETSVVSAAVTVNQDGPVARPAMDLTVAEALAKSVEASIYYRLTGTIKNLKNTEYGNFDLVDETGSVYVYGLTTEKTGSNDKSFSKLGLKEGDVLTLEGTRAAYNGVAQVGGPAYYISHEAGDAPAAPGPKSMTIAEAVAQTDSVLVSGTVMALCAKGFILQDESGIAFIYDSGYSQTYVVGDQVKVGGKPGAYNYANQITPKAKYYEKTGSVEVTYPEPVVLNAAKVAEMKDGAGADKNVGVYNPFYITVEGTVRVSGNYFNLDIDGVETSTAQGSFYQLTDAQKEELTALKDKAVVLTGYFQSISQSGGVPKFFNVIYLTVEEKEAEGGEEPTEKAARNLTFSEATATATLGEEFTAPTLSGETAGVVYSSSNTAVATVDPATGSVTLVGAGETTITAAAPESETHLAGTATYTLTVADLSPVTIASVLALGNGATIPANTFVEGVVISNMDLNNLTSKKGMYIQDESGAVQLRFSADHTFAFGTKLKLDLSGCKVGDYSGAVQIEVANAKATVLSSGNTVAPKTVTIADFLANKYEGQYVAIEGVQVAASDLSKTWVSGGAHTSINMEDANGNKFVVFSSKYATYGTSTVAQGSGTIKGISSINNGNMQIIFAQESDFAGLTGERFGQGTTEPEPEPEQPGTPVTANRADFETFPEYYGQYTKEFTSAAGWHTVNCAIQEGYTTDNNPQFICIGKVPGTDTWAKAVCINGKTTASGVLESPEITGGCGVLSFNYGNMFSEANGVSFKVEVIQNGSVVKELTFTKDKASVPQKTKLEGSLDVNVSGTFKLKFTNMSPTKSTSNKDRVSIWNLTWTSVQ